MSQPDSCPFLVPVTADFFWMHPTSAYCHRPNHRIRVPADATLAQVCTTPGYLACAGYRVAAHETAEIALP